MVARRPALTIPNSFLVPAYAYPHKTNCLTPRIFIPLCFCLLLSCLDRTRIIEQRSVLILHIKVMDTFAKTIPSGKRQVKASESHNDAGKRYMVMHTPFADMAGTTSRARSPVGVNGDSRQRLVAERETRAGKQKRPVMAALPSMSGRAGPKQCAKTRRGHVVLLAPDTVLYLDAEPTLGSRQSSEQGAERSPAQAKSLCSSPLALLACFPATWFSRYLCF
ncbi:hypothetical protein FG05_00384 [Fusarium graminearum]|nr:hypothetical protein FG05_00384 [Fusarium graminearum]